jgi:hypothetical protein
LPFTSGPSYQQAVEATEGEDWVPSYSDFIDVFEAYGVDVTEYRAEKLSPAQKVVDLSMSEDGSCFLTTSLTP